MEETKTALQAFISSIITIIVAVLSYSAVTDIAPKAEPEVKVCQPDNTYELFQKKLAASAEKPKPTVVTPAPAVAPAVTVATKASPVKVAGSHWNVEGNWNYSTSEMASHLSRVHGVNPSGYSKQEMEAMHDNLHNGYPAMGYSSSAKPTYSQPVTYSKPVTTYSRPTLFGSRRVVRSYSSSCPGGVCPQ